MAVRRTLDPLEDGENTADNVFDSTNVVANEDGSILERLEALKIDIASIGGGGGGSGATDKQYFVKPITSAANAGQVDLGTVNTGGLIIEEIVLRSEGATTGDFTSAAITSGTSLNPDRITHIPTVLATQSNLDQETKQVSWEGEVKLKNTDKLVITLNGSGATAVDFDVTIAFRAVDAGAGIS